MKIKKMFFKSAMMALVCAPIFAQSAQSQPQNPPQNPPQNQPQNQPQNSKKKSQPQKPKQQYADDAMMSQDACGNLTEDEQSFASKLNDANAMMFCSQMSPMQRQKAMKMSSMRGSSGTQMSPDDAVQNVMQNNAAPKGPGACPVQ